MFATGPSTLVIHFVFISLFGFTSWMSGFHNAMNSYESLLYIHSSLFLVVLGFHWGPTSF